MSCNEASKCFTICVSAESGGGMKAFRKPPPPPQKKYANGISWDPQS